MEYFQNSLWKAPFPANKNLSSRELCLHMVTICEYLRTRKANGNLVGIFTYGLDWEQKVRDNLQSNNDTFKGT